MDKDLTLPLHDKTASSSLPDIFPPNSCACEVFIDVITKNEAIYEQVAREEEAKIQKNRPQETIELL